MALDAIIHRKRQDVATRMRDTPLASFRGEVAPTDRSLHAALSAPRMGFIMECKKASPSRGLLRACFDPAAIAASYAPFADAISVLTDTPYFQGSFEHLRAVRASVRQPVLCKDFVVDPYQIYEARHHGADAILLMCSVLEDAEIARCLGVCAELSMDALVEVRDPAELNRAVALGARIIGVNNRDLATLRVDLATTERLCPRVPRGILCISESGIDGHTDVRRLAHLADAFLVGSHLMQSDDLDAAVRELVFGRVKICGLTRLADAHAARDRGAFFGGLVLWSGSPRAVSLADAEPMCREVPLDWVGVFVNAAPADIADAARRLHLSAVQLHGDEDPTAIAAVRAALHSVHPNGALPNGGCALWKAWRARDGEAIPRASDLGADRLVVDAYHPDQRGGTGTRFDWSVFREHPDRHAMLLSGGIDADNGREAQSAEPWAIDLSSGVESAPGKKDPARIESLFNALRGTGRP